MVQITPAAVSEVHNLSVHETKYLCSKVLAGTEVFVAIPVEGDLNLTRVTGCRVSALLSWLIVITGGVIFGFLCSHWRSFEYNLRLRGRNKAEYLYELQSLLEQLVKIHSRAV